jgi:putative protein kinase ArgK-like GTPase of G3E family
MKKNWTTQVLNISSIEQSGFIELQKAIDGYFLKMETSGFHLHNRNQQDLLWFESSLIDELQIAFANHPNIQIEKQDLILKIKKQEISVQQAAKFLVQKHLK